MLGMEVDFIEKYKLNPSQCIMVGDMKVDNTLFYKLFLTYVLINDAIPLKLYMYNSLSLNILV